MRIQIGKNKENLFLILPKEAIAELGWNSGDIVDIEVVDGGLKAVRVMTKHDRAMEIADQIMDDYRETFEALAKM
jgi:bifunctional DNA-binding transcriptional regulator/antitoxin component of YhaV-PrlF toxin-antitoxin module